MQVDLFFYREPEENKEQEEEEAAPVADYVADYAGGAITDPNWVSTDANWGPVPDVAGVQPVAPDWTEAPGNIYSHVIHSLGGYEVSLQSTFLFCFKGYTCVIL